MHDKDASTMSNELTPLDVPDHVVESLARCLLPTIREYFDNEEGQREFAKWNLERERSDTSKERKE